MKKILFALIFIASINLNAQIYFAGEDVLLYVGQTLTIKERHKDLQKYGLKGFMKKPYTDSNSTSHCPYLVYCDGQYASLYDSLVNLKFICTTVYSAGSTFLNKKFILQLFNEKTDTIYYLYDSSSAYWFALEVKGGITPIEGYFCKDISTHNDKFEGKKMISSPLLEPVFFEKYIDKGSVSYFLRLSTIGVTAARGKGVIILLDNGEKIIKSNLETSVKVNSAAKFEHSAFITLTQTDIAKLRTHKITDFKLYIHEESDINGHKYRDYLNCLLKMN